MFCLLLLTNNLVITIIHANINRAINYIIFIHHLQVMTQKFTLTQQTYEKAVVHKTLQNAWKCLVNYSN